MEVFLTRFNFDAAPTIATERLLLRRISEDDRSAWLEVWNSPGVLDYLVDMDWAPRAEVADEIIAWAERIVKEASGIRWAITLRPADKMIGSCGFHLYSGRHRRAEVGYELHSAYWRRGIMSEALAAVLTFCFERLDLHRVEADVVEGNAASAALLHKAGFTLEGAWRDRVRKRGVFHTLWQFSLLAPEYRPLRRRETDA